MSISRAFKAFFGDPQWLKKTGLGVLVMLIPYVGTIAFMGFGLHYLRAVAWGHDEQLPEWKDFGEHLKTGFLGFVVGLVYTLPLTLVAGFAVVAVAVAGVGAFAYAESITSMLWFFFAGFVAFSAISVLMGAVLWPAYAQVALHNSIQAGLDFKGLWSRTRVNASSFWKAFGRSLLLMLVSTGASMAVFGAVFGLFALMAGNLSSDTTSVALLLLFPLELLATALLSFVSLPVSLMNSHIWGEYARVAYELDQPAAQTV